MSPIGFRPAAAADMDTILSLMARFYDEYSFPFHPILARAALEELLRHEPLGRAWLIESGGGSIGYVVVTFGFSFEFFGREAFLDELYVVPESRHEGAGSRALAFVEAVCAESGVNAVHAESEDSRPGLREFYTRHGFADRGRCLLTKWLRPHGAKTGA